MYTISSQMSMAMHVEDQAFGGKNMIFAGDFAQLPPPGRNPSLYSQTVKTVLHKTHSHKDQKWSIGKSLWHQVTVVVILRQNMRQKSQTPEDAKFRTALENMHYKSCTDEDIALLRSRISGTSESKPKLSVPQFRHVSIITALNAHRDKINEFGSKKFASDMGTSLISFYSKDKWHSGDGSVDASGNKKSKATLMDPLRSNDNIAMGLQEKLWELPHGTTEHHPGRLSLCLGMPVMIKCNEATECCVTNGAEATVVGWKAHYLTADKLTLDTLFVKLTNPPNTVQLDGLPENVVPVSKQTISIKCDMPNDDAMRVSREQVPVLPNFAMTDFASQGRTHPFNVIDLNNCRSHQSMYTCLSRSASLQGTILLQGFDPKKIQGGLTGFLRQEFRELEILDNITRLRYLGELPPSVSAVTRTVLIRSYQLWKGTEHVPKTVHPSIEWSKHDPMNLVDKSEDASWQLVGKKSNKAAQPLDRSSDNPRKRKLAVMLNQETGYICAKGTKPLNTLSDDRGKARLIKKRKLDDVPQSSQSGPAGLTWEKTTLSCAYDSILTILHHIFVDNRERWDESFSMLNDFFSIMTQGWDNSEQCSLEDVRNTIRLPLSQGDPESFPYDNKQGTDIYALVREVFSGSGCESTVQEICEMCETVCSESSVTYPFWHLDGNSAGTVSKEFQKSLNGQLTRRCVYCRTKLVKSTRFSNDSPPVVILSLLNAKLKITQKIVVQSSTEDVKSSYRLRGVVYHGSYHFTARIIDSNNCVWYHDGMTTGKDCVYEGKWKDIGDIGSVNDRRATLLIYVPN